MKRPDDLFDRESEWRSLADFLKRPGPGVQLGLVRGRRRQGKSFLLRRLAHAANGFYFQAVDGDKTQALEGFGEALGTYLGVPGGRLALANWEAAVEALLGVRSRKGPAAVVIDEFPYLLSHSPELPSIFQRAIDKSRDEPAAVRLVLCGSALSVMAGLLTGAQALRGRASLDLVVRPFDFRLSAKYWGIDDVPTAFRVHAILGGTPGYRDLLPGAPPRRVGDIERWLTAGVLNPSSAMFREAEYLLTEERSLSDRSLYQSVLTTIANGHSSQGAISAALRREQRAIQHPLRVLEEAGFVRRTDDVLRERRPIYSIVDPIVRFHNVVTLRDIARFEDRRTTEAWADSQSRFSSHVLGPHFEDLACEFALRFASPRTLGGRANHVGPAIVNDARGRSQHELDVVATAIEDSGAQRVVALGEAKHTTARRTTADLERLDRIRGIVSEKHPSATSARVMLFAANGFDRALVSAAAVRSDVELIDLERMYRGD